VTAVLLDLDGVLVDSRDAICGCLNHALVAHGREPLAAEALHHLIGPPIAVAFAELLALPADAPEVAACIVVYRERYAEASLRETRLVPGIEAALDALGRRHRLAVATSKAQAFTEPLLAVLGLRGRFEVVAGTPLAAVAESKATVVGEALAALGHPAAVMVGDRRYDVDGAGAHGVATIGVTWGTGTRAELEAAGAAVIVEAVAELPAAADALLARRPSTSRRS
jgi:phosphoglycolate phosphatase